MRISIENRHGLWIVMAFVIAMNIPLTSTAAGENYDAHASGICITNASFIAPTPEKENLNGEWVEISNMGGEEVDLNGWILVDGQDHEYVFPEDFFLGPGYAVRVHTGIGEDNSTDLYWNRNTAVWNNDGDVAEIRDDQGEVVATYP